MSLDEEAQRTAKLTCVRERFGFPVDRIVAGELALGYRFSAKRSLFAGPVLGSRGSTFGSFADMQGCLVDHPRISKCFDELRVELRRGETTIFDRARAPFGLRHAWAKTNGRDVMLTLVSGGRDDAEAIAALAATLRVPSTVAWSIHGSDDNRMRGRATAVLRGPERLDDHGQSFGPDAFMQPNPEVARLARQDLVGGPAGEPFGGGLAFDLYAGTGATTALLRSRFASVEGCEIAAEAATVAGVEATSAERFLASRGSARVDLVVANPPRAGFGDAVCGALATLRSPRLHVMSCNAESLARDLAHLDAAYTLECVRAYDTLPQTAHLELVAWLALRPSHGAAA